MRLIKNKIYYVCSAWYPNLNKKFKSKLQTMQNKRIACCLQLDNRNHIRMKDFEKVNWLQVSEKFNQYLCSNAFKFFKEACPLYFHDIHKHSGQKQVNTRSSVLKLKYPLRNTCSDQNNLSYLTAIVWDSLSTELKLSDSLDNFKYIS